WRGRDQPRREFDVVTDLSARVWPNWPRAVRVVPPVASAIDAGGRNGHEECHLNRDPIRCWSDVEIVLVNLSRVERWIGFEPDCDCSRYPHKWRRYQVADGVIRDKNARRVSLQTDGMYPAAAS